MPAYTHDIIIIGGGAGGLVTAVGCAQLGLKTAIIDKDRLGGDCLYYGCVPSKTLLKTATVYHQARNFPAYGLPETKLPEVDMARVTARVQRVIGEIAQHDAPERFEKMGIDVHFGDARFASPHEVVIDGGAALSARSMVVSTGSSPRSLPIPGLAETGYITNLDVFSLQHLPKRLLVIGAGPIGIEMTQAFLRLGSRVTTLDVAPRILPKDDADMTDMLHRRIEAEGGDLRLGVSIKRVEAAGGEKRVVLAGAADDGGDEELIAGDEILLAAGRKGNIEDLELEKAGIEVAGGFIKTDSKLRSSQRHILAVGDVNGRYLFTHVAGAEGSVAVRRLGLRLGGSMNYRSVPWVTYTDPEVASIGYNEESAREAGIGYRVIRQGLDSNDRAQAEGEPDGHMKVLIDKKDRVIGTQITALHASDLLLPSLFAVGGNWKVSALMKPIFPYPSLGEIHKKGVSAYMAPKLFNSRVRRILRMVHRYRGEVPAEGEYSG
jgi:pyruvate/2-oxoglutarate dehydrogenase complex dihydrolipoamide dehydrogenase (E3) component